MVSEVLIQILCDVLIMKRILVLGSAGSGKSTLTKRIGHILMLPVIHLDKYYWNPNWEETPADEWKEKVARLTTKDKWVMDGGYYSTLEMRVKRADSIIFIDFPRRVSYLRIFLRFLRYRGETRPSMTERCPERLDWEFLKWIWSYPKTKRSWILGCLKRLTDTKEVFFLHSQNQIDRFVELLGIRSEWVSKRSALYSEFRIHD